MSVIDRVESARHTLTGSAVGKAVTKATSREIIGPKRKHVDYLLRALDEDNVNIPQLGDLVFERCSSGNWVIVFKSLICCHHLLSSGNERFIQYCASRSVTWMLNTFLDRSGVQGYDMSHAIRRYSHYLNEKAAAYREMGYDFCRIPRGKEKGVLRNTDAQKLLKALPVIQRQLDALLSTEMRATDLVNGVITAAFMLLFKDLIRLFACYNDGIINLLEKYFDMKKLDCKAALEIYKKFVNRMERVSEFLKAAEEVGIDKGDIPDLTKAPSSLLEALENHLHALEKGKSVSPPSVAISLPAILVNSGQSADPFRSDGFDSVEISNEYLEQEKRALELFEKSKQHTQQAQIPVQQQPQSIRLQSPPVSSHHRSAVPQNDAPLFQAAPAAKEPEKPSAADDLLQLSSAFGSIANEGSYPRSVSFPLFDQPSWTGQPTSSAMNGTPPLASNNPFASSVGVDTNFQATFTSPDGATDNTLLGDILAPMPVSGEKAAFSGGVRMDDKQSGDINSSLARVAKSLDDLSISSSIQKAAPQKGQHQWKPQQPQMRTGGANFQNIIPARSTLPPHTSQQGWGAGPAPMGMGGYTQPMGYPTTYGYGQPGVQMSGMMGQPSQRMAAPVGNNLFGSNQVQDPFGPVPGAQARF